MQTAEDLKNAKRNAEEGYESGWLTLKEYADAMNEIREGWEALKK